MNNSEVKNVNMIRFFHLVNGPLLSIYFVWTFLNQASNYQEISTFELYLIKVARKEVKDFIYRTIFHKVKSPRSWDSSNES